MVGGGGRGTGAGIAQSTTIQAGTTIEILHLFIETYPGDGEMTTGAIVGKDINGTTSEYPIEMFNETGGNGKKTGIGKRSTIGVFKGRGQEQGHRNQTEITITGLRDPTGTGITITELKGLAGTGITITGGRDLTLNGIKITGVIDPTEKEIKTTGFKGLTGNGIKTTGLKGLAGNKIKTTAHPKKYASKITGQENRGMVNPLNNREEPP